MKKLICLFFGHIWKRESWIGKPNSKEQIWKCKRCAKEELWEEVEPSKHYKKLSDYRYKFPL